MRLPLFRCLVAGRLNGNADTRSCAASPDNGTPICVDDNRRCEVITACQQQCSFEVPGGTVKHALGSTATTRPTRVP
jgi:hypothetical protein